MNHPLDAFNCFNWNPNPNLSDDENYMDLTLLVTRSSKLKHGSMACILVRNFSENDAYECTLSNFTSRIISVSTNQALFTENESDVHAEIAAIGQAALYGRATLNCTAYITMPPCRKCFAALFSAGVRRIVSRHDSNLSQVAEPLGINMLYLPDWDGQRSRTQAVVQAYEEKMSAGR